MTQVDPRLNDDLEEARLRSVDRLNLLDSAPEDRFTHITRMARAVFGVPMSSVSLLARDRQWFKAIEGMEAQNIPRPQTVCQTTVARAYQRPDDPALIVEDLSAVPEFAELPGVAAPDGVRFYAGYPLYGPGGHPVGTFCIFDVRPRELSDEQRRTFTELAKWAQREIEDTNDLARASAVQRQLLPNRLAPVPGYEVAAMCLPAFAVGGDFYDHYRDGDDLTMTVADVMGKGLGAAILTASVRSAMRAAARAFDAANTGAALGDVVRTVSEQLADDFAGTETFATVFHARLHTPSGHVEFVDAGHGLSYIRRADGSIESVRSGDLPLGILPDDVWETGTLALHPGDMLVIPSDGLLDLLSENSDTDEVHRVLGACRTPDELCSAVRDLSAAGAPIDDVTVVAVRRVSVP
jgi:sigma-B regulation protein RsbU (phosphoserine phosphatase)